MINSQHLGSHEQRMVIKRVGQYCVINRIFDEITRNIIIGEEKDTANLFANLNRI